MLVKYYDESSFGITDNISYVRCRAASTCAQSSIIAIRLLSKFIHASESRDSNQNFKNNEEKIRTYGMKQKDIDDILQRFKVIVRVMNYSKTQMSYAMHPKCNCYTI